MEYFKREKERIFFKHLNDLEWQNWEEIEWVYSSLLT